MASFIGLEFQKYVTTVIPVGERDYNGKQVLGADMNTIFTINGNEAYSYKFTNFYTLDPLTFHGFNHEDVWYSVADQTKIIPKIASIGDSSKFITENVYLDRDFTQKLKSYTQTWSLSSASDTTAWLCNETDRYEAYPSYISTECYEINDQGSILKIKDYSSDKPNEIFKGKKIVNKD